MTAAMSEQQIPIPAATVVVMRDREDGPPELLMLERARAMAFAGGALVFPGGRVDPADHTLAALYGGEPEDTASRIAAVRETLEEAGLAVGLTSQPDQATMKQLRAQLADNSPLVEVLHEAGLTLALDQLVPFARWCPNHPIARVFDTRFYLTRAPEGAIRAVVDATENVRLFWATAEQVLADADAGRATLIFPTRRNLERLATYGSYAEAAADAARYPIRMIAPWREDRDGVPHLCIPDDLGYPISAEPISSTERG